jgi:hypothetical protein
MYPNRHNPYTWDPLYQQLDRVHPTSSNILSQLVQQLYPRPPVSPIPPFQVPQSFLPPYMQTHVQTPIPTPVSTPTSTHGPIQGPAPSNLYQQIVTHQWWLDYLRGLLATENNPNRRVELQNRIMDHMNAISYLQQYMRITT